MKCAHTHLAGMQHTPVHSATIKRGAGAGDVSDDVSDALGATYCCVEEAVCRTHAEGVIALYAQRHSVVQGVVEAGAVESCWQGSCCSHSGTTAAPLLICCS